MQVRTQTLIELAQTALAEASMKQRTDQQSGRLIGVALWYLCEAASKDSHAVIVPHVIIKTKETK